MSFVGQPSDQALVRFRLPEDLAAELSRVGPDMMQNVSPKLTFGDGFDQVERELGAELMFENDFERLALSLLRALFRLPLETSDLTAELRNRVAAVLQLKVETRLRIHQGLRANLGKTGGDALLKFESNFATWLGPLRWVFFGQPLGR